MAEIVYTAVTDATSFQGGLFEGAKFWLSQKVPQRKRFIEEVKANGGEITLLEKEADVKIVDHARKEKLPGTYSYKYIEDSVRNGALEDLEKHAVGPPIGAIRAVGSTTQPAKSGRTKFSAEDDQALINWVAAVEQNGGATSGNEIYKQLEAHNPRHTWQSWRDRWVKTLKNLPGSASLSEGAPPAPPVDQATEPNGSLRVADKTNMSRKPFTKSDAEVLLEIGRDIENILPDNIEQAWATWAEEDEGSEHHSADDWRDFWERSIRPIYLKCEAERAANVEEGSQDLSEEKEQVNLPVRVSPLKKGVKQPAGFSSPSLHPESLTRRVQAFPQKRPVSTSAGDIKDGASGASGARNRTGSPAKRKRPSAEDEEEVPSSSPLQPKISNERKRRASEDGDEVPSSSPPQQQQQRTSTKRLRHHITLSEVAPVPNKDAAKVLAREIPDTYAADQPGMGDVVEIDEEELQVSDEQDSYSEASHSLSPELGSSPKQTFTHSNNKVSKTQAAFQEPAPSIEYELPAPEGGWPDEDNVEVIDDEDDEQGVADEKADYDKFLEEEGRLMREDEDEEGNRQEPFEIESSIDAEDEGRAKSSSLISQPSPPASFQPTIQALLANRTQAPDFSLAEPEGGWDNVLPPLADQIQEPDFSLAEPEGGWDTVLPPSSPPTPSPSSQSDAHPPIGKNIPPTDDPVEDFGDQVDEFITEHTALGHDEDSIFLALRCTNMDPDVAVQILGYMKVHKGRVPRDTRGCWTEEDDGALGSGRPREIERLERKHGDGSVGLRTMFLEQYRKGGEE